MLADPGRIRSILADVGLDAIVATDPSNVTYLTGFHSWDDAGLKQYMVDPGASNEPANLRFAALIPGAAVGLVTDRLSAANAVDLADVELWLAGDQPFCGTITSLIDDEKLGPTARALGRNQGVESPIEALVSLLRDRGVADGRIGLDSDWLGPATEQRIRDTLHRADVRNCSNLFRLIRSVKSDTELAHLEHAASTNEAALSAAVAAAGAGVAIDELGLVYRRELVESGAEFEHFLYGVRGLGAATQTKYELRSDDVVLADFGCIVGRYFADTGLTIAVDTPEPEIIEAYSGLAECIRAGRASIRPGALTSDIHEAMSEAVRHLGLESVTPEGHGIGLEMRDYPIVAPNRGRALADECISLSADLALEPGMVINLEAAQFRPAQASLQCERSFVVTLDGVRDLIFQDRDALRVASRGGM